MNTPGMGSTHHILSVLVENKAGVLSRVAALFSRRGFNIFSLAVSPTNDPKFSRMTIVVDVESTPLEQIVKQLYKLINVIAIDELAPSDAVERELMLITLDTSTGRRGEILELVNIFKAEIVDVSRQEITIMLVGTPATLDDFEKLGEPIGITGLQRTGRVALPKLSTSAGRLRSVG